MWLPGDELQKPDDELQKPGDELRNHSRIVENETQRSSVLSDFATYMCTLCACGIPLSLSLSLDVLCVPAAFRSLPLSLAGVAGFPSPSSLCV